MKDILVYIEVYFSKFLLIFGIEKSIKPIPKGTPYCYIVDDEKNKEEDRLWGYYIKPCKYYRHMNGQLNAGCTYVGYVGFEPSLCDQCKICGVE